MWCVHNEIWFMIEEFFQVENWFSEIYRWIYIHSHSFVVFTHTKKNRILHFFSLRYGDVVAVSCWLWYCFDFDAEFFFSILIVDCFEWLNWSRSGFEAMILHSSFFFRCFISFRTSNRSFVYFSDDVSVRYMNTKMNNKQKKRRNQIHLPVFVFFSFFIKIWKC